MFYSVHCRQVHSKSFEQRRQNYFQSVGLVERPERRNCQVMTVRMTKYPILFLPQAISILIMGHTDTG